MELNLSGRMKPEGWAASPAVGSRGATEQLLSTAKKAKFCGYPGKSVFLAASQFPYL